MFNLREAATSLKPGAVQEYLRSRGWTLKEDLSVEYGVVLYEKDGGVLDVPLRSDYADYGRRMAEVIAPLAKIEGMTPLALLEDLARPAGDVLAIRVHSDRATSGTLPLLESLKLREGAKNLLLAAAHSAISPQPWFPRMSRAEAVELISGIHEGQTQRGSFISRFIIPVEPAVGTLPIGEPFGRRVTRCLMQALENVRRVRTLGAYDDLLGLTGEGVSGNLLGALATMRPVGATSALEMSISWSRNRAQPEGLARRVRLSEEMLKGLEVVAEAMRNQARTRGFTVSGYVARLARPPGEANAPGDVVIVPSGGDTTDLSRLHVHLDPESYNEAIRAHERGSLVRVVGTLGKSGRRWTLSQASGFELLADLQEDDSQGAIAMER